MTKKISVCMFTGIILALVLSACGPQATPTPEPQVALAPSAVIAEGHLVPRRDLTLSFPVRGRVNEILIEEGGSVKKGDVLIRLADREQAEAAVAAAALELTAAQQAFDEFVRIAPFNSALAWQDFMKSQVLRAEAQKKWEALNLDNIDDRIDDAEAEVQDMQEALDDAQKEFDKYADLNENNTSRQRAEDDLEAAQEDYNAAVRDLETARRERDSVRAELDSALAAEAEAKRKFEATLSGPDAEQLALLQARLDNAKAQSAAAENNLSNYDLTAPFDGLVMDINLIPGEWAGPEKWAVVIADTGQWFVETSDLTELEVVDVAVGQEVALVADALPEATLTGVVEEISQTFKSQGGDILYTVRIRLDEIAPLLRWGMTVEVTFEPLE
jgi:multidrug resistance efflux pump